MSKHRALTAIQIGLVLVVSGCSIQLPDSTSPAKPINRQSEELKSDDSEPQANARRFNSSQKKDSTPVESAIKLSEKYTKLFKESTLLQRANQDLAAENKELKEQVAELKSRLNQSEKELNEANELLRAMIVELNNWKVNVLGFQQEMRKADEAQLTAILKILKILGGEVDAQELKELSQQQTPGEPPISVAVPDTNSVKLGN